MALGSYPGTGFFVVFRVTMLWNRTLKSKELDDMESAVASWEEYDDYYANDKYSPDGLAMGYLIHNDLICAYRRLRDKQDQQLAAMGMNRNSRGILWVGFQKPWDMHLQEAMGYEPTEYLSAGNAKKRKLAAPKVQANTVVTPSWSRICNVELPNDPATFRNSLGEAEQLRRLRLLRDLLEKKKAEIRNSRTGHRAEIATGLSM